MSIVSCNASACTGISIEHDETRIEGLENQSRTNPPVRFNTRDISSSMLLDDEGSVLTCLKGFRTARSNYGVTEGCWFCEFEVLNPLRRISAKLQHEKFAEQDRSSHIRVGWASASADADCSVGFDQYSWSLRDATGEKIHQGHRVKYGIPFNTGDTIGCLLWLAPLSVRSKLPRRLWTPKCTGQLVLCPDIQTWDTAEKTSDIPVTSFLRFYINGRDQGIAFINLTPAEKYFAAASSYFGARIKLRPGPKFTYPPPNTATTNVGTQTNGCIQAQWSQNWRPLQEAAQQ